MTMDLSAYNDLRILLREQRQAALGTLTDSGAPFVSMVLYALETRVGAPPAAVIHVSRLAAHTRQLQADPRASLMIMQPDTGAGDPQALARVTLECSATPLPPDSADYAAARAAYLGRLPTQEYLFAFPDFGLFRLELRSARYIGGFAQAFSLDIETLALALR
jgi:putative heme iron utilization protein